MGPMMTCKEWAMPHARMGSKRESMAFGKSPTDFSVTDPEGGMWRSNTFIPIHSSVNEHEEQHLHDRPQGLMINKRLRDRMASAQIDDWCSAASGSSSGENTPRSSNLNEDLEEDQDIEERPGRSDFMSLD